MRNLLLFIIKNKDHFVFAFTFFLSISLLFNRNDDDMSVIRGFSSDFVSFLSSPMVEIKSLAMVNEENQYLREKNLQLNLIILLYELAWQRSDRRFIAEVQ